MNDYKTYLRGILLSLVGLIICFSVYGYLENVDYTEIQPLITKATKYKTEFNALYLQLQAADDFNYDEFVEQYKELVERYRIFATDSDQKLNTIARDAHYDRAEFKADLKFIQAELKEIADMILAMINYFCTNFEVDETTCSRGIATAETAKKQTEQFYGKFVRQYGL